MNDRIELARDIVERTGCSLFLTGRAGTGKTTFLRELRASSRKRMVVTAPTGIAAINAGGVTLHSFFQLDFGPFVPGARRQDSDRRRHAFSKEKIRIICGLDLLVIDEISMVRADMLDAVDAVLRRYRDRTLPFGGVQLLMIGDLQQLPPVVVEAEREIMQANYRSPYFFDSHALEQVDYLTVELDKVYRQTDSEFLRLLNAVRDNRADAATLARLNSRYKPGFSPADAEGYVRLTTHNNFAHRINSERLDALDTPEYRFRAKIQGNFPESSYPADAELVLKEGAQVMFIKNDTGSDRRFFNGMLGRVTAIDEEGICVTPTDSDDQIEVEPMEWENVKFVVNEETKEITEHREGVFTQYPLKPAWAITIHKSQGLTFDRAIIDASMSFTHGQTYVALSRCRTLDGLVLDRPIPAHAIISDPTVTRFMSTHHADGADGPDIPAMAHAYYMNLVEGMFNFRPLFNAVEGITRIFQENFTRLYPAMVTEFTSRMESSRKEITDVADRFRAQLRQIDAEGGGADDNPRLTQRIKDASKYFGGKLAELLQYIEALPTEHDNKSVRQKLQERMELFYDIATLRSGLLSTFATEDFTVDRYLDIKAGEIFRTHKLAGKKQAKGSETSPVPEAVPDLSADNHNPALFETIREWRKMKSEELKVPAYMVLSQKSLLGVSNYLPRDFDELGRIPGIGPAILKKYGDTILDMVDEFILSGEHDVVILKWPPGMSKKKSRNSKKDKH